MILSHGATRKHLLREVLGQTQVMTTVQLQRHDLLPLRTPLRLPQRTYTIATRTTQQTSQCTLTFVALEEAILQRHTPPELGHLAGLAEAWLRVGDADILHVPALSQGEWRLVQPAERQQGSRREGRSGHLPDAEILGTGIRTKDWAVEMDAGYPRDRKLEKLRGFAQQGYRHILWVTSVHGLVRPISSMMQCLHDEGQLPGVVSGAALFTDYWSERDPFRSDRRCHDKRLFVHRVF
ncbi:hypothetical protein [Deinococcus hopiensis]|uniref:Uncharacterized protein n=1 Tax=Deinococcus hopiensis KR-140 TaxID=695939 RepID=A0A1W1VLF9_9DEIO|nr:hypothetical protein [Deinococcus hopiensis]SMB94197.1 hypothetical protein SAMN00790413_02288 [Deinococcus hopiensis KR-140]